MAAASFLTSGTIRIVVAGMFDGMIEPFLVYHGENILLSLCRYGPVIHMQCQDTEHLTDSGPAGIVGKLKGNCSP